MKKGDLVFSIEIKEKAEKDKFIMSFELGEGVGIYHAYQMSKFIESLVKSEEIIFDDCYPDGVQDISDIALFKIVITHDGENHFFDGTDANITKRFDMKSSKLIEIIKDFQILIAQNVMLPEAKSSFKKKGRRLTDRSLKAYFDNNG